MVGDKLPEAYMFNTGTKQWQTFDVWPPQNIPPVKLYFGEGGRLFRQQAGKRTGQVLIIFPTRLNRCLIHRKQKA